jgi:hypothetical protein
VAAIAAAAAETIGAGAAFDLPALVAPVAEAVPAPTPAGLGGAGHTAKYSRARRRAAAEQYL